MLFYCQHIIELNLVCIPVNDARHILVHWKNINYLKCISTHISNNFKILRRVTVSNHDFGIKGKKVAS